MTENMRKAMCAV